jgi:hypothetical protein
MRLNQLDLNQFRSTSSSQVVDALLPTTKPQQSDDEIQLLTKLLAVMRKLQPRAGVVLDAGGIERAVLNSGPKNVAQSQTDSAVVAAVPGFAIVVVSVYALTGATATNLTFNSKPVGAGTAISALLANAANGGQVLPFNASGWFKTNVSEGLSVTTGAGATTGLQVNYYLVPNYAADELGLVLFDEAGNPTYVAA